MANIEDIAKDIRKLLDYSESSRMLAAQVSQQLYEISADLRAKSDVLTTLARSLVADAPSTQRQSPTQNVVYLRTDEEEKAYKKEETKRRKKSSAEQEKPQRKGRRWTERQRAEQSERMKLTNNRRWHGASAV